MRNGVFRSLWFAQLGSNVGSWMQTVGAQWLLVSHAHASTLVALVQTASLLPVMVLSLPAGVLADVLDRRRLLLVSQSAMAVTAGVLALLTQGHLATPATLLALTFVLGCGQAVTGPAWQAIQPELVKREEIPAAAALGSLTINLARAVGPAIAGLIVAAVGPAAVFGLNAVSFLGVVGALYVWRRPQTDTSLRPEPAVSALHAGTRYVANAPSVRRILLRAGLFVIPGSALWALLPVVAHDRLGMGAAGYGGLLGALGVGAVLGALYLAKLRAKFSTNVLLAASAIGFGLATLVLAIPLGGAAVPVVSVLMVAGGLAWIVSLSTLNASLQLTLPAWVRARGFGAYLVVFMGGQALGSVAWGALGSAIGDAGALTAAAILLALCALSLKTWPLLKPIAGLGHSTIERANWPEPTLVFEPEPDDGPVMVTRSYTVADADREAFLAAMVHVGRSMRRTGATSWAVYRDGEIPDAYTEVFTVRSWDEHLRQHDGRLTDADREFERVADALVVGDPVIAHYFPPR
jgi:predicted MFS family arabinose efflux permease